MTSTPPRSHGRRLRFSLRTLLLLVFATGAALGWTLYKVRQQGNAVAALEKIGCTVYYADDAATTILETLRRLLGEKRPRNVVVVCDRNYEMSDGDLVHLQAFTHLKGLSLRGTRLTDAGLRHLERHTQLEFLELDYTSVTDKGLERLRGLVRLNNLRLSGTARHRPGVNAPGNSCAT